MLDRSRFYVRQDAVPGVGTRTTILDPDTQEKIGYVQPEDATWKKVLTQWRLDYEIYSEDGPRLLCRVCYPVRLWRTRLEVRSPDDALLAYLNPKVLSLNYGFWVHDASGKGIAEVKGDWTGWEFVIRDGGGNEIASISKKPTDLKRALLYTGLDDYVVSCWPGLTDEQKVLVLGATQAIERFYYRRR
jgi:hypothetical protein